MLPDSDRSPNDKDSGVAEETFRLHPMTPIALGGRVLDKTAERVENVGQGVAGRHHFEESFLTGELSLRPVSLIN